ncbi:AAA family ATPase [Salibacterium aidingense]|uniref:AAA family ATPase n=1 Tax=Salibacterium aidingense TaxID=384933 RepID=UPI003BE260A6
MPEFDEHYMPDVSDSYEWLAGQVKDRAGKADITKLVDGYLSTAINEESTQNVIERLQSELERIKMGTTVRQDIGRTLTDIKSDMEREYVERESGRSFTIWKTPYESLNDVIGGFFTNDVYGIMAESGRGKTYLVVMILDCLLRQGAKVLVKSFEVKEYSLIARLISVITSQEGVYNVEDTSERLGIPVRSILSGKVEEHVRDNYFDVLRNLDSYYDGELYLQTKGQEELTRSLDDLERELATGQVDVAIIDPFYSLDDVYGRNANKTTGGAADEAAARFETIIGKYGVVGMYTVQAEVKKKEKTDEGMRELRLPTREDVKTSKRLLAIATILLSFDSVKAPDEVAGQALIGVEKGRDGGEDLEIELVSMLDYGVLKEPDVTDQF